MCALALGGAVQLGAGRAAAQECEDDGDCAAGLICKSYGEQGCDRPAIDCVEGEDCPEPAPCEPTEIKACALPPCESDDDCPSGTVCHGETYTQCSEGGGGGREPAPTCPEGEECPQPEEPVCDEECKKAMAAECEEVMTEPMCTPTWQLPCTEDADCGAGFTCEEIRRGSCSGSAGSAGAPTPSDGGGSDGDPGDGAEPAPPEERPEVECTSEGTGEFHCQAVVTECSDDADCEQGWTCDENPDRPVCSDARPPQSDGDTPDQDMPVETDDCGSDEPERVCLPPYHGAGGDVGVARGDSLGTAGGDTLSDDESAEPPSRDAKGEEGGGDDDKTESDGDEAESEDCAVAAPGSGAGNGGAALGLLALLGLFARLRRRVRVTARA
jgi:MYXO-CTERM domain-containing protein